MAAETMLDKENHGNVAAEPANAAPLKAAPAEVSATALPPAFTLHYTPVCLPWPNHAASRGPADAAWAACCADSGAQRGGQQRDHARLALTRPLGVAARGHLSGGGPQRSAVLPSRSLVCTSMALC